MQRNFFGEQIYTIQECCNDKDSLLFIRRNLVRFFLEIKISQHNIKEIIHYFDDFIKNPFKNEVFEENFHKKISELDILNPLSKKLTKRKEKIKHQILKHIAGNSILDFGCGNGAVGEILSQQGYDVSLTDIYKHKNIKNLKLKYYHDILNKKDIFEKKFDTILLLTVLHHCDNPLIILQTLHKTLKDGGRIIIIESIYDIYQNTKEQTKISEVFFSLNAEQQKKTIIFFDFFLNRVIDYSVKNEEKIHTPYNFNTFHGWNDLFKKSGFTEIHKERLGFDHDIIPEYHSLHILEKNHYPPHSNFKIEL